MITRSDSFIPKIGWVLGHPEMFSRSSFPYESLNIGRDLHRPYGFSAPPKAKGAARAPPCAFEGRGYTDARRNSPCLPPATITMISIILIHLILIHISQVTDGYCITVSGSILFLPHFLAIVVPAPCGELFALFFPGLKNLTCGDMWPFHLRT